MLQICTIYGNIYDKGFKVRSDSEYLLISRNDLEKKRLRRTTDKGTDVIITLDSGNHLHNGDVLIQQEKHIIIKQIPEKIISVTIKESENFFEILVLLGHIIGNRHRPIYIKDDMVQFPIQSVEEKEIFEKLFSKFINQIQMTIQDKVFTPDTGANIHEHG